jgi:hypothetical protein
MPAGPHRTLYGRGSESAIAEPMVVLKRAAGRSVLPPMSDEAANSQRVSGKRNRAAGVNRRARALMGAALLRAHDTSPRA